MIRNRDNKRQIAGFAIIMLAAVTIIGWIGIRGAYERYIAREFAVMGTRAEVLASYLERYPEIDHLQQTIDVVDDEMSVSVEIFGPDSLPVALSASMVELDENIYNRHEIKSALLTGYGQIIRREYRDDEDYIFYAVYEPDAAIIIPAQGSPDSVAAIPADTIGSLLLRLAMPVDDFSTMAVSMLGYYWPWLILMIVCLGLWSIRSIIKSNNMQKRMAWVANQIYAGDISGYLENGSESYPRMHIEQTAKNLEKSFDKIERQRRNLRRILNSLGEGVIVTDQNYEIVMANKLALDFLSISNQDILGLDALITIRVPEIRELLINQNTSSADFVQDNRYYRAYMRQIEEHEQLLVIIRDISRQVEIQRTKADFVSNVSHELRTPLTLIRGYSETLMDDEISEEQQKYVGIILRHTDRMIALVNDLLNLSQVELGIELDFSPVDVCEIVSDMLSLFAPKAKKSNVNLVSMEHCANQYVYGDRNLIEIALSNLIDNAIKYNKLNGDVAINIEDNQSHVSIAVQDSGKGIPSEDISRIFERFYMVDKAHSYSMGGTGLGLSIVKHIMIKHKGEVNVQSKPENGSIFKLKFVKYRKDITQNSQNLEEK